MLRRQYLKGGTMKQVSYETAQNLTPDCDFPNIGRPALNALTEAGYTKLSQLTKVSEKELLRLHGVGPKAIRILSEALAAGGNSFAGQ
jgi:hypothetical protein